MRSAGIVFVQNGAVEIIAENNKNHRKTWGLRANCKEVGLQTLPFLLAAGVFRGLWRLRKLSVIKVRKLEKLGLQIDFCCVILPNMKIVLNLKGALY